MVVGLVGMVGNGPHSPFARVLLQASSQLLPPLVLSAPVRLDFRFEKEISQLTSTFCTSDSCCYFVWGTGWHMLLFRHSAQDPLGL